jgi:hypothetical protein
MSLLTYLNNDDCVVINVDEVRVEEIANMLLERPPTLRQVRRVRRDIRRHIHHIRLR